MGTKEKISEKSLTESVHEKQKSLVLFNDDYNTFDFIIESLIEICEHDILQAENCALIAHYKGKCQIKKGTTDDLRPKYVALTDRQITVEIV